MKRIDTNTEAIKENTNALNEHSVRDDVQFDRLHSTLEVMKNNHLAHIERGMTSLVENVDSLHEKVDKNTKMTMETRIRLGEHRSDINWLKWVIMAVGGAVIVSVVGLIFTN